MKTIGEWVWYNDRLVKANKLTQPISKSANRIYEVLRVVDGKPLFLADHFNRFVDSCSRLNIQTQLTLKIVEERLMNVLSSNKSDNCNIRFEEILEENDITYACYLVPFSYPKPEVYKQGVSLGTYAAERPDPHIKQSVVNNRIRQALSAIFEKQKVFEILLIDHNGCITEGSRTNVFFVRNNTLISPPTKDILEGITRKKVLEIAEVNDIAHKEEPILLTEVDTFDACFLTGTSPKILPVNKIDKINVSIDHPILQKLMTKYDQLINENGD